MALATNSRRPSPSMSPKRISCGYPVVSGSKTCSVQASCKLAPGLYQYSANLSGGCGDELILFPATTSFRPSPSISSTATPTANLPWAITPFSAADGRYHKRAPSAAMISSVLPSPSSSPTAVPSISVAWGGSASKITSSQEWLPPLGGTFDAVAKFVPTTEVACGRVGCGG
jgi:hypothetical protein